MSLQALIESSPYFSIKHEGELTLLTMNAPWGQAVISTQGAQLLSYIPADQTDLLWLSPNAKFAKGKAIRGGIPICWPWFGAHDVEEKYPAHGYARTSEWQCTQIQVFEHQAKINWSLTSNPAFPPYTSNMELEMTLGEDILLQVRFTHTGEIPERYGIALHSYFPVTSINQTSISGLNDKMYFDKTNSSIQKQIGDVSFSGEVDRVYKDVKGECVLNTNNQRIQISSLGFQNAIVWNPGEQLGSSMGDIGPDHWDSFACVENGNVQEHSPMLIKGEQFVGTIRIARR